MKNEKRSLPDYSLIPIQYNSLEELRRDKRRLGNQIHKSFKTVREGVKQSFLPVDEAYLKSSSKYMRFIGYGLTAWKTAKTFNRFVQYFKKK